VAQDSAVVVAGGFGVGLATAGLLARHFGQVTIVERDVVPNDGKPPKALDGSSGIA
jgi:2-polyprenyl-6-methoxyphenol hydroxylase-like FAD-dependent oxidoreductase